MRRGLALILVVGVLGVLAVLGSAFAVLSRLERKAASQRVNATKAWLLARSGVEDAMARVFMGQEPAYGGEDWNADGTFSAMEQAQEVYQPGTSNVADCPVKYAMCPSFFKRDLLGQPWLGTVDGKQRGISGRLSEGEECLVTALRLARALDVEPVLIIQMIGISIDAMAADIAQGLLGRGIVPGDALRAETARATDDAARRGMLGRCFAADRAQIIDAVLRDGLATLASELRMPSWIAVAAVPYFKHDLAHYSRSMQFLIDAAEGRRENDAALSGPLRMRWTRAESFRKQRSPACRSIDATESHEPAASAPHRRRGLRAHRRKVARDVAGSRINRLFSESPSARRDGRNGSTGSERTASTTAATRRRMRPSVLSITVIGDRSAR